jgi:protein ImuA
MTEPEKNKQNSAPPRADAALLSRLRRRIAAIETAAPGAVETPPSPAMPFALGNIDECLGGGLALGDLHEIAAPITPFTPCLPMAQGAASGFALALAARVMARQGGALLWIQQAMSANEAGTPYGPGLSLFGLDPARLLILRCARAGDLLRAAEEGLACRALALVLAEAWDLRAFTLAASRRLRLAARSSGVTALMLFNTPQPPPSAARTRWRAAPLPSAAGSSSSPGFHLGAARWRVALEKNRTGRLGAWNLEWDPHACRFTEPPPVTAAAPAGPVAALSCDRPDRPKRRTGGLARAG